MKTRIRASQYSFLILLPVLMAVSGSLRAQGPSINSLSFTPASINTAGVSASVTVNFNVTGQGVYYFATAFADPNGNYIGHQVDKSFTPGNSITDSVTISFPPFSAPGTWRIAYAFALDANGFAYLATPDAVSAAFPALGSLTVSSSLDTTPPNLTSFTLTPAAIDTTAASATVSANFTVTDDLSGANFFQVQLVSPDGNSNVSATASFAAATTQTGTATLTFPRFSQAGTWTVGSVFISDAAGNTLILATPDLVARGFPTTLTVTSTTDTTPPTLTTFSFAPNSINVTGAPANVTVSFQVADDLSGATTVQVVFLSPTGNTSQTASASFPAATSQTGTATATFPKGSEAGAWTVSLVFLSDAAGNTRLLATSDLTGQGFSTQLTVANNAGDTTPPVIVPTVSPAPNTFGWNTTTPVTVSWSVTDPESGINSSTGCGNSSVTAQTTGITFTCSATNGAGLTNSASVTVRVDLTPPVVTANVSPTPTAAGWNNTSTTLSWSLSDPTSGINLDADVGCGTVTLTAETAGATFTCTAVNGAGLSTSVPATIKIDMTPPTATAIAAPSPNGAGWNNTNVTVTFAGTDALSGIASCTAPVTLSTEGTGLSASGICTDNAGNTSVVATAGGIKIDKTAPVASNVKVTPTSVYINNGTTLTATITDSLSGVASAAYNIDGGGFIAFTGTFGGSTVNVSATTAVFTATGVHNICVVGTDAAGNANAPSCTTLAVFTAAAPASGTTCNGAYNGTFNGTIFVSNGQVCDYEGTVTGSIQQGGGTLILLNATVDGSVQITSGGTFSINTSTINGSLQITSLPNGTVPNQVCGTTVKASLQVTSNGTPIYIGSGSACAGDKITGSLQVQSNHAQTLLIGNTVGGSLQDNSNVTSVSPATQVTNNTITSALQCSANSSIIGSGNTASVKQGQCSAF